MPRTARIAPDGMVFRVLNGRNARARIFGTEVDYAAFERAMCETLHRRPMRIPGYVIMSDHWRLVLWPERDGDLAAFMHRLTITHVHHCHLRRKTAGWKYPYQGTYRSFPVEADEHLLAALCYVERNALRAGLVKRAEDFRNAPVSQALAAKSLAAAARHPVELDLLRCLRLRRSDTLRGQRQFGSAILVQPGRVRDG